MPCTSFVELFGAGIAQRIGTSVRVDNLGVPGMTSTNLLTALCGGGPFASAVADADVVTITIGANDFQYVAATGAECPGSNGVRCYRPTLRFMKGNLQSIIERIKVLRTRRPTDIQITGYWDIWADGAVARARGYRYVEIGNDLTKLVNRSIAEVATAESVRFVDLFVPFRGVSGTDDDTSLLAPDGDHPNQRGHDLIAAALLWPAGSTPEAN